MVVPLKPDLQQIFFILRVIATVCLVILQLRSKGGIRVELTVTSDYGSKPPSEQHSVAV